MPAQARRRALGAGLAVAALAVGVTGIAMLRATEPDEPSGRVIHPVLDKVERVLPRGSVLVDKAVRLTSDNLKTIGRVVFVSPVPGAEARRGVARALGWNECESDIFRPGACASPGPDDVVARIRSAVVGDAPRDPGRLLLGDRAGEFPAGSTVVEVLVGTE